MLKKRKEKTSQKNKQVKLLKNPIKPIDNTIISASGKFEGSLETEGTLIVEGSVRGRINPNVAYLCRGKTRKSAPDVAAHRLGQVEAYLTVREVLSEARTAPDGVLSRERSGFCRCRYATLGLSVAR